MINIVITHPSSGDNALRIKLDLLFFGVFLTLWPADRYLERRLRFDIDGGVRGVVNIILW